MKTPLYRRILHIFGIHYNKYCFKVDSTKYTVMISNCIICNKKEVSMFSNYL
jgi:hypothetical protein